MRTSHIIYEATVLDQDSQAVTIRPSQRSSCAPQHEKGSRSECRHALDSDVRREPPCGSDELVSSYTPISWRRQRSVLLDDSVDLAILDPSDLSYASIFWHEHAVRKWPPLSPGLILYNQSPWSRRRPIAFHFFKALKYCLICFRLAYIVFRTTLRSDHLMIYISAATHSLYAIY